MNQTMTGTCEICGKKEVGLIRTVFAYPHIKCECHSPSHFIIFNHCADCKPEEPNTCIVHISTAELTRLGICAELAERATRQI